MDDQMEDAGHPPGAGASEVPPRAEVLARVPLLTALSAEEREQLAELFVEISYHAGDTVCRQGEEGTTFFVVVSGELEVWGGPHGDRVINRLGPGEVLGEMSLLAGGKRAATVTAARTTRLLALNKAGFDRYLLPNAKVLEYFSRLLCRRLATLARGEVAAKATRAIAVSGRPGLAGKTLVASTLAALVAKHTTREALLLRAVPATLARRSTDLLYITPAPSERLGAAIRDGGGGATLAVGLRGGGEAGAYVDALTRLLGRLGERFPFIVLDLGPEDEAAAAAAAEVADALIQVVDAPGAAPGSRTLQVINLHNPGSRPIPVNRCEPFVIPESAALRDCDAAEQARRVRDDPWLPAARPLHRLARKILGASVGLALGSGAAFGLAHIGVLKLLEEHDVPVDLVTGCSMGSVIALGYATGMRAAELIEAAQRIGTAWTTLSAMLDFSLTRPGLLTGDRLVQILMPLAGPIRDFEQLVVPCRLVATDIESGERVAIGTGPLEVAFRASSAVPMLWAPVRAHGRVLVDGGVSDPVPAEVVQEMGADLCIAVNVVPPPKKGVDTVLSRLYRRVNVVNPFSYLGESRGLPSMFDLIMNTMQTLQHELGNFKAISADVRINPDLSGHTWIEFYQPRALIARGAEAAELALPEIKRVLGERLAAGGRG